MKKSEEKKLSTHDPVLYRPMRQTKYRTRTQNFYKLQKLYSQPNTSINRRFSSNKNIHNNESKLNQTRYKSKTTKEKQELLEQNNQLKSLNNELQKQLVIQKTHTQAEKNKNKKFTTKLKRQFQKEIYYTQMSKNYLSINHNYLVAGVKEQYSQIKQKYEKLLVEHEQMKKDKKYMELQEYKIYAQAVQSENARLKEQLILLKDEGKEKGKQEKNDAFVEGKNKKQIDKKQALKSQIKELKRNLRGKDKKLAFLEQLVIQKNNIESKLIAKDKKQCAAFELLKDQQNSEKKYQQNLIEEAQKTQQAVRKQLITENCEIKRKFEAELIEKRKIIKKQQREIQYLKAVISSWRPDRKTETEKKENKQEEEKAPQQEEAKEQNSQMEKLDIEEQYLFDLQPNILANSIRTKEDLDLYRSLHPFKKRKTGSERRRPEAVKSRKVDPNQVTQLPQVLKYRLIGRGISFDEITSFMKEQSEFISMSELRSIFIDEPFCLSEEEAVKLSRYIVQDDCQIEGYGDHNVFVYVDDENQIERRIAQSILRAFIGQYELPPKTQCEAEWNEILKERGDNLHTALKSLSIKGLISRQNWKNLLNSMTIDLAEQTHSWLIGRMMKGNSLDQLHYEQLFL